MPESALSGTAGQLNEPRDALATCRPGRCAPPTSQVVHLVWRVIIVGGQLLRKSQKPTSGVVRSNKSSAQCGSSPGHTLTCGVCQSAHVFCLVGVSRRCIESRGGAQPDNDPVFAANSLSDGLCNSSGTLLPDISSTPRTATSKTTSGSRSVIASPNTCRYVGGHFSSSTQMLTCGLRSTAFTFARSSMVEIKMSCHRSRRARANRLVVRRRWTNSKAALAQRMNASEVSASTMPRSG